MELTPFKYFENNLKKRQIEDIAKGDVESHLSKGNMDPLETQIFFKRLKAYVDKFIQQNENFAIEEFHKYHEKTVEKVGAEVNYIEGGSIPDYSQDLVYAELKEALDKRKSLLDLVYKTGQELYDDDGVKIPKVKTKTFKKSSLTVRI